MHFLPSTSLPRKEKPFLSSLLEPNPAEIGIPLHETSEGNVINFPDKKTAIMTITMTTSHQKKNLLAISVPGRREEEKEIISLRRT
jgi:hypothetical protein